MVAAKKYNNVDPKNTQLMILATKIEALEGQLREKLAAWITAGSGGGYIGVNTNTSCGLDRDVISNTSIEKWRVVKKGVSITVDGKSTGCARIMLTRVPPPAGRECVSLIKGRIMMML